MTTRYAMTLLMLCCMCSSSCSAPAAATAQRHSASRAGDETEDGDDQNDDVRPSTAVDAGGARSSTPSSPSITVTLAGSGTGTVSSTPGAMTCADKTCTGTYAPGTSVTLRAEPGPGVVFSGWAGACTGATSCAPKVDGPIAVTATFEPLGGTWKGPYTHSMPNGGCVFNNKGEMTVSVDAAGTGLGASTQMTGMEIRDVFQFCALLGVVPGTSAATPMTPSGSSFTGTWNVFTPFVASLLPLSYSATISGNTLTGTWTCPGCTGSFTLTKQ